MIKGIMVMVVIIIITVIIYGGMAAQHNKTLANVDDSLKQVDAALTDLVASCQKDVYASVKENCNVQILNAWTTDCINYPGKLDSCKTGGVVEKYLKEEGLIG